MRAIRRDPVCSCLGYGLPPPQPQRAGSGGGHAACWSPLGRGIGSCEGAGVWGAELRAQRAPESRRFDVGGGLPVTRPLICIWPTQCGVSQFSRSRKQGACRVWGTRNLAPLPGCH